MFSLSGLTPDERDRYAGIIHDLDGELDNGLTVKDNTTHLIVHAPSKEFLSFWACIYCSYEEYSCNFTLSILVSLVQIQLFLAVAEIITYIE